MNNSILEQIDIDRKHIDEFVLETEEGTKRTKERFHKEAVVNRNRYVNNQHIVFDKIKVEIANELIKRLKNIMPQDKSAEYNEELSNVEKLLDLVKMNSTISDSFKLKIDFIIESINEGTSLEELNEILKKFIDKFRELNINLSVDNFKYTMFTEKYMESFFKNSDYTLMKDTFEKIYFACPDIKLQLKMNLYDIVDKQKDNLSKAVSTIKTNLFNEYQVNSDNVINKYTSLRYEVGNKIATDEYNNTEIFLSGKKKITDYLDNAPARVKNYNTFAINGDYNNLTEESKLSYNSAIMGLYLTLNELKKYYTYEFIVKDLLERYKSKDSVKGQYESKKKEIQKEEKKRQSIYKDYLKGNGIGLFQKKNENKIKDSMLRMNEQVKKLNDLYEELRDLEITYNLSKLSVSASIYDLFVASLSSFIFLKKSFLSDEVLAENTLESNIEEYFRFLYNPNNNLLRKINVFTDYDIVNIVAEKFKLLNLAVSPDIIDSDNIDATMESVRFINLIQNIERSNTSIQNIYNICRMNEINNTQGSEGEDTVI